MIIVPHTPLKHATHSMDVDAQVELADILMDASHCDDVDRPLASADDAWP